MTTDNTNITVNLNDNTADTVVANVKSVKVKGKVGRPAVAVQIPSKGSFTLKDLQSVNPSVKSVTLRAHVIRSLKNGTLTKLAKNVKTGKKGKPAHKFMSTESLNDLKTKTKTKTKTNMVEAPESIKTIETSVVA
jgi:hypothetical protein